MKPRAGFSLMVAASVGMVIALQHLVYATMGGVHREPAVAVLLVATTLAGAGALWISHNGRTVFAWPGFILLWIPFVVTYPVPLVSIGGWAYVFLLALLTVSFLSALVPPRGEKNQAGPENSTSRMK